MCSYIKVAVYVTAEYSGEKFALKLGQILSVHTQVTHPGPVTVLQYLNLQCLNGILFVYASENLYEMLN